MAPDGIDERELSRALQEHWGLAPAWLGYLPVGFGDHHWDLTDSGGRRWFVTVAGLTGGSRGTDPTAGYADLQAAMDTVIALAGAGLEFAVAPVPTTGGQALAPLGGEHAITVFPYLDAAGEDLGDEIPEQERSALIDMLARLHNATPQAARTAPVRRLDLAARPVLEAALEDLGQPWTGGPYSERARQLLARHASHLGRALASFDELARGPPAAGPRSSPTANRTTSCDRQAGCTSSTGPPLASRCQNGTCGRWPTRIAGRLTATPNSPAAASAPP